MSSFSLYNYEIAQIHSICLCLRVRTTFNEFVFFSRLVNVKEIDTILFLTHLRKPKNPHISFKYF